MRVAIPFLCLTLGLGACAPAADVVAISPRLLPPAISLGPDVHLTVGERAPRGVLHRWNLADTAALPAPNLITRTGTYTTSAALPDSIRHLQVSLDRRRAVRCVNFELFAQGGFNGVKEAYRRRYGPPQAEWHDDLGYYATWGDAYVVWNIAGWVALSHPGVIMVTVAVRDPAQDPVTPRYDPGC